jgi:16S rRNA (cytosine1402-N4)-methyltransferase
MADHVPVMCAEAVDALAPSRGGVFVDATVGLGGHAAAVLAAGATRLVGIDRDEDALAIARERLAEWADRVDFVHANYRDIAAVLDARGLAEVEGILVDLGVSSLQFDGEGRGFSFQRDEPLDMRMDRSEAGTAADLIADLSEEDLANLIYRYGEERYSRRIARSIVQARCESPVTSTGRLAALVRRAVPYRGYSPIHPATKTFQALRIAVNGELEGLDRFIDDAVRRLSPGGRLVVIAFHSLEDRIVKHTMRQLAAGDESPYRLVTRKAQQPTDAEIDVNPRSRSARLRAIERMA